MLRANKNYGEKHYHGNPFGLSHMGTGWRLCDAAHGGTLKPAEQGEFSKKMLMFGNCWIKGTPWTHPDAIPSTTRWFYWDNPQLPHLLYQGVWNPKGYKNWCRIVECNTATQTATPIRTGQTGSARINRQLGEVTNGTITHWEQIVGDRSDCRLRGDVVMLCPPSGPVFEHYYATTKGLWIHRWRRILEDRGYTVIIRDKPQRQKREQHQNRLYQQLQKKQIAFTVSIHSVSAIESILAGVPAVVEGRHPADNIGTAAEKFLQTGEINTPTVQEQNIWIERLLMDTFHKTECYDGSWYNGEQHER